MKSAWCLILIFLISAEFCCATERIEIKAKYGPEFTFTNDEIIAASEHETDSNNKVNQRYLKKWSVILKKLCKQYACIVDQFDDKHGRAFKVEFKNGDWINFSSDTEVLEVQTNPRTTEDLIKNRELLNTFIFDSSKWMGLKPHEKFGGGHVNVDLDTGFREDSNLFRNFMVDQANHPEFSYGVFGNDSGNAPPISMLEDSSRNAFIQVINEFDQNPKAGKAGMIDLRNDIDEKVYTNNPRGWLPTYYQSINMRALSRVTPQRLTRVEMRGFKPQVSIDEYISQTRFLDDRLTYLANLEEPLQMQIPTRTQFEKYSLADKLKRFGDVLVELNYPGPYDKYLYIREGSCIPHIMFNLL